LSNLKQIGLASLMYADDYDETLPPWQVSPLLYWVGGRDATGQPLDKTRGLVWPYIKSGQLHHCLSYTGGQHLGGTGYGMNTLISRTPLAQMTQPADTLTFADSGVPNFPKPGEVGETIVIQPPIRWVPLPEMHFRHHADSAGKGGFANAVWADGHAKAVKREAFLQLLPVEQQRPDRKFHGDFLMATQK
jgi:prepilin-type processing-associated H-X9-DG protein